MKLILKIARTELRILFFSPVAWFLALIFLIICAVFYSNSIFAYANTQETLQRLVPSFKGFDNGLTGDVFMGAFMRNVFSNLYLFIPLLTMGLINKEFNGGTVKLLYSSPVKLFQIVWGKYLAIMAYNMMLLCIMLLIMAFGICSIEHVDMGHIVASLIAFYLVMCAYTAIGMFMSSITHYQIVAGIATFTLLFLLQSVGGLWQEYDFIRDLTYFLAINGRAERMVHGLITTRDIMYYVLLTYMFVTFSYLSLRHGRELVSSAKKTIRYATVFLSVLLVGYLSSRPGYIGYWDGTENDANTINVKTQNILENMQSEPMEVTLYTNLLDPANGFRNTRPEKRNIYVWGYWDKFIRFKPNIKFNYVLYYDVLDGDSSLYKRMPGKSLDSIAAAQAKIFTTNIDWYLKPDEIRKKIDLQPEGMRSVMHLKYKGKSVFLRMYNDNEFWPSEEHMAAALKRLSNDTVPKIYATTGNLERNIHKRGEREFSRYSIDKLNRSALINHGFEFDTLNLNRDEIPADASALVLADPKVMLNDTVHARLKEYMTNGGNLLIVGEPGKQYVLNPLIQQTGVQLMTGTLVQISNHETPDKITPFVTMEHVGLRKEKNRFSEDVKAAYLAGSLTRNWVHPGTAPLSFTDSGFQIARLMVAGPKGMNWVKAGQLVTDSAAPVLVAKEGDYMLDSFNVALALNRQVGSVDQRIAIVGDADFMSNMRGGASTLVANYLSWMTYEAFPIDLFRMPPKDILLNISLSGAQKQKIMLIWILPAIVLILGSLLLLRRKRQ